MIREQLDEVPTHDYKLGHYHLETLDFYVWFNEELLDESRLAQLLLLKDKEIEEIQAHHDTQTLHFKRYEEQINRLKYQKLSASTYEAAKEQLQLSLDDQVKWQQRLIQLQQTKEQLRLDIDATIKQIQDTQMLMRTTKEKLDAFETFSTQYDQYVRTRNDLGMSEEQLEIKQAELAALLQQPG